VAAGVVLAGPVAEAAAATVRPDPMVGAAEAQGLPAAAVAVGAGPAEEVSTLNILTKAPDEC